MAIAYRPHIMIRYNSYSTGPYIMGQDEISQHLLFFELQSAHQRQRFGARSDDIGLPPASRHPSTKQAG